MKIYISLILLFFVNSFPYSKGDEFSGEKIYNAFGNANCIIQDTKGYLWCGTSEGFSRYDGFIFSPVYKGDPVTSNIEDNAGNILGGTINGELVIYERASGSIKKYQLKTDPLFYYSAIEFSTLPPNYSYYKNLTITSLLIEKNELYIGTWGCGVFVFDLAKGIQKEHLFNIKDENSIPGNYITSLLIPDNKNQILLCGSFDAGLIKIEPGRKFSSSLRQYQFTSLCYNEKNLWAGTMQGIIIPDSIYVNAYTLSANPVSHLFFREQLFAAEIENGIIKLNTGTGKILAHIFDTKNESNNNLLSFLVDKTGIIWGSTYAGLGLIKWEQSNKFFSSYKLEGVTAFAENKSGDLYIATKNKIYKLSFSNNSLSVIDSKINGIHDVCYAFDGKLYIAASDKLYAYDETKISYNVVLTNINIATLVQDSEKVIWAGTYNDGIVRIEPGGKKIFYRKSNIYEGNIPDNHIKKLFISGSEIWGYTREDFLFKYIKEKDEFVYWKLKEKQSNILTVYSNGDNIYIGTYGDGLFKFSKKEKKFYPVSYNRSASTKNVFGILEDDLNNLWFASETALWQYNISENHLFNYSTKDGIDERHFSPAVQYRCSNGKFVFGGMDGFVLFSPNKKTYRNFIPELALTSFKVSNTERIITGIPVELNSSENSISFQFGCLDYTDPQKNQYKWMLEGYDKNYHFSYGNFRTAEYNQLPPGEYVFKFQGANAYGIWSNKEIVIPIVISAPYYSTWWFIALIILIAIALPAYFLFLRVRHRIAIQELKSKLSADLHDDIGSGLTEISLIAEVLKNKNLADEEYYKKQLHFISQRSREIVSNMSDIVWLVNPKEISLSELLIRLKNKAYPAAESIGINLIVNNDEGAEDLMLSMEKRQNIYLILRESVNNAIKYSNGKTISITLNIENNMFKIEVKDDGNGFDVSKEEMGNGLRNMKKRAKEINAEILIISGNGNDNCGTTIVLKGKQ